MGIFITWKGLIFHSYMIKNNMVLKNTNMGKQCMHLEKLAFPMQLIFCMGSLSCYPMSEGSAKEAQHLKWAYYQLLLHLPECPLLLALFHIESGLSLGYFQFALHCFYTSLKRCLKSAKGLEALWRRSSQG